MQSFVLDGESLTPASLCEIGLAEDAKVELSPEAWVRIKEGRGVIDRVLERGDIVYGVNTGFGLFSDVVIDDDKLHELQENLIRSHSAGVGEPLTIHRTRALCALRINVLAKGHSGVRPETMKTLLACLNHSCLPPIPCKGTVGASGDLAPLAHLARGMMGEGELYDTKSRTYKPAAQIMKAHNIEPVYLEAKEGLALINGTQLITALGAEALERAKSIARQADVVAALSLEVLKGTVKAFHPAIHNARPHRGQRLCAERIRNLLHTADNPSEISESHRNCGKVQDSYTMRCVPQIHGIVHETLEFVEGIISTEMNSATDNPMVFANLASSEEIDIGKCVLGADAGAAESKLGGAIISGGNFHGEYPAKALDYLAIGIHEIANVSERRMERLMNPTLSGLPAFLVNDGGLNSGFMIAHCTAAALVSENKVLTHPASVDSISTSAAKEDHVSMGGFAARKALQVVEHVEQVCAIELLAACQALDMLAPLKSTAPLEAVHKLVRSKVKPYERDRYMASDIDAVAKLLQDGEVWRVVEQYVPEAFRSLDDMYSAGTGGKASKQ